jgi:uncharacterized membrane protein
MEDRPGQVISWKSLPGSDLDSTGSVHFRPAPGGRGTEVRVCLKYVPPAGKLGAKVAELFEEDAGCQAREDLQRFKQLMEAGEIAAVGGRTAGQA